MLAFSSASSHFAITMWASFLTVCVCFSCFLTFLLAFLLFWLVLSGLLTTCSLAYCLLACPWGYTHIIWSWMSLWKDELSGEGCSFLVSSSHLAKSKALMAFSSLAVTCFGKETCVALVSCFKATRRNSSSVGRRRTVIAGLSPRPNAVLGSFVNLEFLVKYWSSIGLPSCLH